MVEKDISLSRSEIRKYGLDTVEVPSDHLEYPPIIISITFGQSVRAGSLRAIRIERSTSGGQFVYDMQPHYYQQSNADSRGPPSVFVFHLPGTIAVPKVLPSVSFPDTTDNSGSITEPFVMSGHGATVFIAEVRVDQSDQQDRHSAGGAASTYVTTAVPAHVASPHFDAVGG